VPQVRLGMVLAATSMAMFATNLDFFALNLSIPGMARELDTSTTDMQWVISFMLTLGSFRVLPARGRLHLPGIPDAGRGRPWGRLAERFDIPKTMLLAIVVGAAGLLVITACLAIGILAGALVVFGLCWAMLSVGTQTVVAVDRAGEASGVSLSIVIGMAGLGVAVVASLIEVVAGGGTGEGAAIEQILRVLAKAAR
jgi:MFS family permease